MTAKIDSSAKQPLDYSSDVPTDAAAAAAGSQGLAATLPGTVDVRGVDDVAKSTHAISAHNGIPVLPKGHASVPDYTTISTGMTNTIQAVLSSITELALIYAKMYNKMQESETNERTRSIEAIAKKMETEADQIRESAAMTLAAGVVTGSMQIASGAVTAGQLRGGVSSTSPVEEEPLSPSLENETSLGENEEGLSGVGENEEDAAQLEGEEGSLSATGSGEGGLEGPASDTAAGRPSAGRPGEDAISSANAEEAQQSARTRASDDRVTQQEEARAQQKKADQKKDIKASTTRKRKMTDGEMFLIGQKEARITMKAQAMTQALTGAGGITSAGLKMGADEKSAEEKETEAKVEQERAYKSSLDDFIQDAHDSMQKMMKMASDIQQAYDDTVQKIAER